jgi:hypothetical protein
LLLSEAQGGSGLGLTELCLVAEELGATLSPLPLTAAAAGLVALACGDALAQRAACARCRAGEALVVPVFTEAGLVTAAATRPDGCRRAVPLAFAAEGFAVDVVHAGGDVLVDFRRAPWLGADRLRRWGSAFPK